MTFRPRGLLNVAGPLRILSLLLVIGCIALTLMIYKKTQYMMPKIRWDKLDTEEAYFFWGKTRCVGEEQYARVVAKPWTDRFKYPREALWLDEARTIYRIFKSTMIFAGMAGFVTFIWIILLLFSGISTPIKKNFVLYFDVIFHVIFGLILSTCGICLIALIPNSQESKHKYVDQCLIDSDNGKWKPKKITAYVMANNFGHKAHTCLDVKSQFLRIIDMCLIMGTGLIYLIIGIVQLILHKFCSSKRRTKSS